MKNQITKKLLQQNDHKKIVEILSPYLTDQRKARIESVLTHRIETITLAIEHPADINNALAAVRSCEAFGIATIHIISPQHHAQYISTITKSAFYWVNIVCHQTLSDFLLAMKNENRMIAGAIVNAEKKLSDVSIEKPICILVGNEQRGLTDEAKHACDFLFSIPMCGMLESLNLSVAAAVCLFDLSQRKRKELNNRTDLSDKTADTLRAEYYLNSVESRLAVNLLTRE